MRIGEAACFSEMICPIVSDNTGAEKRLSTVVGMIGSSIDRWSSYVEEPHYRDSESLILRQFHRSNFWLLQRCSLAICEPQRKSWTDRNRSSPYLGALKFVHVRIALPTKRSSDIFLPAHRLAPPVGANAFGRAARGQRTADVAERRDGERRPAGGAVR